MLHTILVIVLNVPVVLLPGVEFDPVEGHTRWA